MLYSKIELAKKVKEKGFTKPSQYAWCKKGGYNKYTRKEEPITYVLRTNGNPFGSFNSGSNWNKEYVKNKNQIICSAPTLSQIQNWLIEEHELFVTVLPYAYEAPGAVFFIANIVPLRGSDLRFDERIQDFNELQEKNTWDSNNYFNSAVKGSYTKALEVGLEFALTLI